MTLPIDAPIYVAGHRGLVGSALLRQLEAAGCRNLLVRSHAQLDLTDQQAVAAFFADTRPAYVFLAAARVGGIHANNTYPAEFIHQNLAIELNIIHQSYRHGTDRLLFLGSSCIYPKHCPQPMREEHLLTGPLEPTNSPYAVAKIAGIEMCRAYNRQYQTSFLPVMPTNLYGPNDNFDLENSHVLPALIRKFHLAQMALTGNRQAIARDIRRFGPLPADFTTFLAQVPQDPHVPVWGSGTAKREFLHVDDMAAACITLMFDHRTTDLINIGTGRECTIAELAAMVRETVGFPGEIRFDPSKPDGTPLKRLDVSQLNSLGWQAAIGLRDGIQRTYHWYLEQTA